ncbi:MAG TPA: hypothetical protein VGJ28_08090 [Micromonosporaceae bacterium]|jgi:hypothetical protein
MRRFFAFWYDFIVGDDATIAIGVVLALFATWLLARTHTSAWWLLPIVTAILLGTSLLRMARHNRKSDRAGG